MSYTNVDSKLKAVCIKILSSKVLASGQFDDRIVNNWWTQISKNASIKDLKKRVVDIINAAGYKAED